MLGCLVLELFVGLVVPCEILEDIIVILGIIGFEDGGIIDLIFPCSCYLHFIRILPLPLWVHVLSLLQLNLYWFRLVYWLSFLEETSIQRLLLSILIKLKTVFMMARSLRLPKLLPFWLFAFSIVELKITKTHFPFERGLSFLIINAEFVLFFKIGSGIDGLE